MKKKWFAAILIVVHLAIVWGILFAVDYRAVMNLEYPMIAQHVEPEGGTFKGIGWTVQIEQHHDEKYGWVTDSAEIYLFGRLVGAAIT